MKGSQSLQKTALIAALSIFAVLSLLAGESEKREMYNLGVEDAKNLLDAALTEKEETFRSTWNKIYDGTGEQYKCQGVIFYYYLMGVSLQLDSAFMNSPDFTKFTCYYYPRYKPSESDVNMIVRLLQLAFNYSRQNDDPQYVMYCKDKDFSSLFERESIWPARIKNDYYYWLKVASPYGSFDYWRRESTKEEVLKTSAMAFYRALLDLPPND